MQTLNNREDETIPRHAANNSWPQSAGQHPKVLIVDDEPRVLRSLQAALKSKFEVFTADGAEQAKQIFASSEGIDIIVSDQRMPQCSGLELLGWSRENHPDCIRILLSSSDFASQGDAILAADIYRCIPKPWNIQEFIEVLGRASQITAEQDRRASDERRGIRRERRSGFLRHRAVAVLDPDSGYREAYKTVVGEITELSEIYYLDSPEAITSTMSHTANIGIVIIDLSVGEEAALNLVQEFKQRNSAVAIIVTSDPASISEFMPRITDRSVHKFIAKPFSAKRIQPTVADALGQHFTDIRKH